MPRERNTMQTSSLITIPNATRLREGRMYYSGWKRAVTAPRDESGRLRNRRCRRDFPRPGARTRVLLDVGQGCGARLDILELHQADDIPQVGMQGIQPALRKFEQGLLQNADQRARRALQDFSPLAVSCS